MEGKESKTTILSAITYTGISALLAGLFFTVATLSGQHGAVARYGGTAWVFLLAMIITMPIIIPFWKRRLKG